MSDLSQWEMILEMFRAHDGVLFTSDFANDRKLSCEYRRALCDLRKHGFDYKATPVSQNLWRYELKEKRAPVFDQDGQGLLIPDERSKMMRAH